MKKLLFFFLSLVILNSAMAQTNPLDSLKNEWEKYGTKKLTGLKDTIATDLLMQIGRLYQNQNADSAILYHNRLLKLADVLVQKTSDKNARARLTIRKGEGIRQLGWDYMILGEMEKADSLFDKAIGLGKQYSENTGVVRYEALRLMAAASTNKASKNQMQGNYNQALELAFEALKIAKEINNLKIQSALMNNIGSIYRDKGEWQKAVEYIGKSIPIFAKIDNKSGMIDAYINTGLIYFDRGDYPTALDYYFKGLKLAQETENVRSQEAVLNNIAMTYQLQKDYDRAMNYYNRALKIGTEMKNDAGLARVYLNIGIVHVDRREFSAAREKYLESIALCEKIDDKRTLAMGVLNMGVIFDEENKPEEALVYFKKALEVNMAIENHSSIARARGLIAAVLIKLKRYPEAEKQLNEALPLALKMNERVLLREIYGHGTKLYEQTNRPAKALYFYRQFNAYNDSLTNEEDVKAAMQKDFQYNYAKKAAADSVAAIKEKRIKNAEIARQKEEIRAKRIQQYALYVGIALVLVFAFFMYNRFRIIRKQHQIIDRQKKEVELQKHIIEEKHKEITDSINYAERIQRSFLATQKMLDENLPEHFVLFQPKDVVSGDFYWAGETFEDLKNLNDSNPQILKSSNAQHSNDQIFLLAVADSTGHGVPGAIMSILNITCLENAIKEGETAPAEILNHTRVNIIERLKKDGSAEGGRDGMDCSLLSFDFAANRLDFALANNPLWLIRDGQLIEYAPDKMPVGKHDRDTVPFSSHTVQLKKGDMIYVFTDGYPDQFGGDKGKKFKYKNLGNLLLTHYQKEMLQQKEILASEFEQWKGDMEQVDDVCIMGIKI